MGVEGVTDVGVAGAEGVSDGVETGCGIGDGTSDGGAIPDVAPRGDCAGLKDIAGAPGGGGGGVGRKVCASMGKSALCSAVSFS